MLITKRYAVDLAMVVLSLLMLGCDDRQRAVPTGTSAADRYAEQQAKFYADYLESLERQSREAEELTSRNRKLLEEYETQSERMERLLTRWERLTDAIEARALKEP